jgi:uncharacterized membrane protein YbhN (UPF0104 family)
VLVGQPRAVRSSASRIDMLEHPSLSGALTFAVLLVVGKILINRHVRKHSVRLPEPHFFIPRAFAALVILGLFGLLATCLWAWVSIGSFGAVVVFSFYTITCLVPSGLAGAGSPSPLERRKRTQRLNEQTVSAPIKHPTRATLLRATFSRSK